MKSRLKEDKIQEALELLNEAAKEKKDELFHLIDDRYAAIKEVLEEKAGNGRQAVSQAKNQLLKALGAEEEKLIKKAKTLEKKIHRNPWPILGAAVLGSLVFGILIGGKK